MERIPANRIEIKIPIKKMENPNINGSVINNVFTVASIPDIMA